MGRVRIAIDREGYRVLPFTIGIVAPLSGDKPPRRRWVNVDRDTFDDLFTRLAPQLTLPQGTLSFRSLDDFEPTALAPQLPHLPAPPAPTKPTPADGAQNLIESLFGSSSPPPPKRDDFMSGLINEALSGTQVFRGPERERRFDAADAVRAALREPAFRRLETAWRGLQHVVRAADTGVELKLRVFDGGRDDLSAAIDSACEPTDEPFGLIVADAAFGPTDEDVAVLYPLVKKLAAAHGVLLAGWADGPEGRAWGVFRRLDAARHLALVGPRVLARRPYTEADGMRFDEVRTPEDGSEYVWMNAAYRVAGQIAGSASETGWFANLHGSRVTDLPTFTHKDEDGDAVMRCPFEVALDERREREWAGLGATTLVHIRRTDQGQLPVLRSVQQPAEHAEAELTQAAGVMSRLPFVLATGRFVHAARVAGADADELNGWLAGYVSAYGPLLDGQATRRGGRVELFLQPWLGREELPGAVAVEV